MTRRPNTTALVYLFLLLIQCCQQARSYYVSWLNEHKLCTATLSDNDQIIENTTCRDADYMEYIATALMKPTIDPYHEFIFSSISNMFNELHENRIPAMINLDSQHIHNSTRRILLHPLSFSIPDSMIRRIVPEKTQPFAQVPTESEVTFHLLNDTAHFKDIQDSLFAITYRNGGWDTVRHVEILAAGTIPLFVHVKNCPHQAATAHPKKLYRFLLGFPGLQLEIQKLHTSGTGIAAAGLMGPPKIASSLSPTLFDKKLYSITANALLHYTRATFSTVSMASYVLDVMHKYSKGVVPKRVTAVLYLTHQDGHQESGNHGNYLTDSLLHGLKQLLGARAVVDVPRREALLPSGGSGGAAIGIAASSTLHYGGWLAMEEETSSYGESGADTAHHNAADEVARNVAAHKYDVIILGTGHVDDAAAWARRLPLWKEVCTHYSPLEVAWVDGSDSHSRKKLLEEYSVCAGHMFSREGIAAESS